MSDTPELTADAVRANLRATIAVHLEPRRYPFPVPVVGDQAFDVAVKLLTDRDVDAARIEAQRFCARLKVDLDADPDFLEREVQRQIVWRSIHEPFPGKDGKHPPLFPSDADVRELPTTIVEALFRLYLEHQDRVSPMRQVDEAAIERLVATLSAKTTAQAEDALSAFDHQALVRIALALARRKTE